MKPRFDQALESDPTPSRISVERYRAAPDKDTAPLALVHYRRGAEELQLGLDYSRSQDADDRIVGADILAQLGWSDQTYLRESVTRLIEMLDDPESSVISSAAVALGHRRDPIAIPHLLKLAAHPDAGVRHGLVFGLCGHEDADAIRTLISLAQDEDFDVRNWAVFALGSQIDTDTPEIRQALMHASTTRTPKSVAKPSSDSRSEVIPASGRLSSMSSPLTMTSAIWRPRQPCSSMSICQI